MDITKKIREVLNEYDAESENEDFGLAKPSKSKWDFGKERSRQKLSRQYEIFPELEFIITVRPKKHE